MAHPHKRSDGIEAIGNNHAASANAANNIQIPQRQVTVQAPATTARPTEVEPSVAPPGHRRADWLQLSPMASQKAIENAVTKPTRRSELMEAAAQSPHGHELAAIACGEVVPEASGGSASGDRDDR
ncbi:MAG: hypothetical protein AMXMBFR33_33600 [Candidatus Xenobia bacterium]